MAGLDHTFNQIEAVKRSFYLSSAQIMEALSAYLMIERDGELAARIQGRITRSFEDEIRVFAGVRDALVLSSLRSVFARPEEVDAYVIREADRERDEDLKQLRLGVFRSVATIH